MGRLSTHVLDTAHGLPARDMRLRLYALAGEERSQLLETRTNRDGRTERPLLSEADMRSGTFELEFEVGEYFAALGSDLPSPAFLSVVTVRFSVADERDNYHVPLLVSPWSYTTYRGS